MEDASKLIAQGLVVFTNPLPNNQNMNSRTMDPSSESSGSQNPSDATSGHGCINIVKARYGCDAFEILWYITTIPWERTSSY